MAKLSHADSTRMYSWWWDSHISPKNSKWLQENLTDVDAKVKAMIKVIEEDADSFARRAEMYYKKRPELMKLVEELYRAYRALAERYDHATGVIRQAQKTMTEAFPNQVPLSFIDDSDEFQMEYSFDVKRNGAFAEDSDSDSVEKISELKSQAGKVEAEAEIHLLKEAIHKMEAEKEASLEQYRECLDRISALEKALCRAREDSVELGKRANKTELDVQSLKDDIAKIATEKDEAVNQNVQSIEMIAKLENKLKHAEEDARELNERVKRGESEVEILRQSISKLSEEKEALELKMDNLNQQLTHKNMELGRLCACVQEERLRFVEVEIASRTIQDVHEESQEELKRLQDEVMNLQEENKSLIELNLSSSTSIRNIQDEILSLRETRGKLEQEVELRVDQRNALQQELRCLKDGMNDLNKKYLSILEQVHTLGLDPERFGSSVKELQDENSNLKEICQRGNTEKEIVLEKLNLFEQLLEKNCILENEVVELREMKSKLKEKESKENLLEVEIENLGTKLTTLQVAYDDLEREHLKIHEDKRSLSEVEDENLSLKKTLQKVEDELNTTRFVNDQLNHDIQMGKDLLFENELKLEEIGQKLSLKENERIELYGNLEHLSTENGNLCEANLLLDNELHRLCEENGETKKQNEALHSQLLIQINDIHRLESEMEKLFGELYMYMCYYVLYEQNVSELMARHERFEAERTSNVESNTRKTIVSLSKCISSLEKHTPGTLQEPDNEANVHFGNNPRENESSISTDVVSDLQGLEERVQAINEALIEMKQLEEQKNASMHSELQAAMKQIEELKSKVHMKQSIPISGVPEIENEMLTKDIMLDQISDCSPYSAGKRELVEVWDTADWNKSIGLTVCKAKLADPPITGRNSNLRLVSMDVQERKKRKVLERLNSDVQKLMNLEITVQDLKNKLETTEKSRSGKEVIVECETLKGQLNDAVAEMNKLFDLSGKLMKNLEGGRRISEQARRVSEKVGVLQLEVQKVQFALLKLDEETDCTDKTRIFEEKRRVLLRDYLYGVRTRERRKKATCCSCCVQPQTQGD